MEKEGRKRGEGRGWGKHGGPISGREEVYVLQKENVHP